MGLKLATVDGGQFFLRAAQLSHALNCLISAGTDVIRRLQLKAADFKCISIVSAFGLGTFLSIYHSGYRYWKLVKVADSDYDVKKINK